MCTQNPFNIASGNGRFALCIIFTESVQDMHKPVGTAAILYDKTARPGAGV